MTYLPVVKFKSITFKYWLLGMEEFFRAFLMKSNNPLETGMRNSRTTKASKGTVEVNKSESIIFTTIMWNHMSKNIISESVFHNS